MSKTIIRFLSVALLTAILAGCGGPDLSSPESCARSYWTMRKDREAEDFSLELDLEKWQLDCAELEKEWYADKSEREKQYKKDKTHYDFRKSNKSDLTKYEMEVVEGASEVKAGDKVLGKQVKLRIKQKVAKAKGDKGEEYELKDKEDDKVSVLMTEIEKKWKIKSKAD